MLQNLCTAELDAIFIYTQKHFQQLHNHRNNYKSFSPRPLQDKSMRFWNVDIMAVL